MSFEKFSYLVSYAAVFCGFLSLWISGTFGLIGTGLFIAVIIAAWFLEDSRWQVSERLGTALIVLALPAFYLIWRFQLVEISGGETIVAGMLARMILTLTAIKLLQKKSDRDWIFLYLMSFFEVLLAAGLSISALYLGSFLLYLLVMVCAVIAFEIRKTSRRVEVAIAGTDAVLFKAGSAARKILRFRRLPTAAVTLIFIIILVAVPLFFMLPRVGGAGFGGGQIGLKTSTGFSDTVRLGGVNRIQQDDAVVMRVMLEQNSGAANDLYFRGIALDTFDNHSWSKSKHSKETFARGDRDLIQVDYPITRENLTIQTIYLEPMDTAVLFALPRALAVQGNFPFLSKDVFGGVSYQPTNERISYKVLSDRSLPSPARLRADDQRYTADSHNYRQLPGLLDERIADLAERVIAAAPTRYDKARAMESYLQSNFGYTLDQRSAGSEPLASFLFDIREGHCEYFATAMAVMLRTQGIATRIVTGFHGGEYNDTADVTVVRQRNAHAWVEVYFPKENVWVPFDPTPSSGEGGQAYTGVGRTFNKYFEALETFWIQYFVAFDNQEQRSLARSMRDGDVNYQVKASSVFDRVQEVIAEWWADVRGDKGLQTSIAAVAWAAAYVAGAILGVLLLIWFCRRIGRMKILKRLSGKLAGNRHGASIVEFYERLQALLAEKGMARAPHQTPSEFAFALGMPQAVRITERYHEVRFGNKSLSRIEADEIENWLTELSQTMADGDQAIRVD